MSKATLTIRGGVVLSHASRDSGGLVTPHANPEEYAASVEAAQPGCVATPVWDRGSGYVSAEGLTPEQIINQWAT